MRIGVISLYCAHLSLEYRVCNGEVENNFPVLGGYLIGHGQIGGCVGGKPYDQTSNLSYKGCLKKQGMINTIKGETDHQPRLDAWDKRSELVLWEDLEGAGGEGGGRGDRDGEDM